MKMLIDLTVDEFKNMVKKYRARMSKGALYTREFYMATLLP